MLQRALYCLAVVILVVSLGIGYLAHLQIENEDIVCRMASNIDEKMAAFREEGRTAFVVGYTGEVGKEVVKELATSKMFSNVFLIGRRQVKYDDELFKDVKMEQKVVDFDKLEDYADVFKNHSVGICLMGTTKGKAGKEGFKKVDHDYIMKVGELAKAGGCQHYNLMSSMGANKNSYFLYPKVKGQVEDETEQLGFDRLSIYRPSILLCEREESRPSEWFARKLLAPMEYLAPGTMTSPTTTVAKSVINTIISPKTQSVEIFEAKAIHRIAQGKLAAAGAKPQVGAEPSKPPATTQAPEIAANDAPPAAEPTPTNAAEN